MKRSAALLVTLLLGAPAFAETPIPAKSVAPKPPGTLPLTIKADPTFLKGVAQAPPQSAADQVDAALANVKTNAEALKAARNAWELAVRTCETRTYSAQDMHDAGCLDRDTVADCTAKLFRACTHPGFVEYRRRSVLFRRAVQVLSDKAQALAAPDAP